MICAWLTHLGHNMWKDIPRAAFTPAMVSEKNRGNPEKVRRFRASCMADSLLATDEEWRAEVAAVAGAGCNTLLIDLGEAIVYPSHPELAVKGSWTPEKLRRELAYVRSLGLEPVPKLNFSATHDSWLGEYHRMLSTPTYYRVCEDVIRDVVELFNRPRYFHIGFDEEDEAHQKKHWMMVIRRGELWWHDFLRTVGLVEKLGCRAWCWSDYVWHHKEFLARCPKNVLQSNWYYGERGAIGDEFDLEKLPERNPEDGRNIRAYVSAYLELDRAGFEQVPTASTYMHTSNFANTVRFCQTHLDSARVKGYMMAPWLSLEPENREKRRAAVSVVAEGRRLFMGDGE